MFLLKLIQSTADVCDKFDFLDVFQIDRRTINELRWLREGFQRLDDWSFSVAVCLAIASVIAGPFCYFSLLAALLAVVLVSGSVSAFAFNVWVSYLYTKADVRYGELFDKVMAT